MKSPFWVRPRRDRHFIAPSYKPRCSSNTSSCSLQNKIPRIVVFELFQCLQSKAWWIVETEQRRRVRWGRWPHEVRFPAQKHGIVLVSLDNFHDYLERDKIIVPSQFRFCAFGNILVVALSGISRLERERMKTFYSFYCATGYSVLDGCSFRAR